jgi:uncharacterized membrane protein
MLYINVKSLLFKLVLAIVLIYASLAYEAVSKLSWLGVFLFISILFEFIKQIGNDIPVRKLLMLIALLQWVIAPLLSYHLFDESEFYSMQVSEEMYMAYVIPGILALYLGMNLVFRSSNLKRNLKTLIKSGASDIVLRKRGRFLYTIGFIALLLQGAAPTSLQFAFFLLAKLIYIGAFYLLSGKANYRYLWLSVAFVPLLVGAQGSTVFHDLFLWGGFAFMIYALINQIGLVQKILFLLLGVFSVLFVQFFKSDYREEVRFSKDAISTQTILEVAEKRYKSEGLSDDYYQSVVDRLNQGWIIARIMYVVPAYEAYAEGETIMEGVRAALIPRFLDPDKVQSGGAYFERFTKIELKGTSMNLGLIGEAYANYGPGGAYIFLFIIGWLFKIAFNIINKQSFKYYEILLWLPFLFLYVVKAEDDFATMFNQFTKSILVCLVLFFMMGKIFPRSAVTETEEIEEETSN